MATFTEKQELAILKIAKDIVWRDEEFTEEELGTLLQKAKKWDIDDVDTFKELWQQSSTLSFLRAAAIIEEFDEEQKRVVSAFFLSLIADNGIEESEMSIYETVRNACALPSLSLSEAIKIDKEDNNAGQVQRISFNGGYYEGETKNGLYHGKGRLVWDKGDTFEGEFENGKHTRGTYCWPNGEKYCGQFRNGVLNGYGKYFYSDGSSYEGLWCDGMKQGFGIDRYTSGDYTCGEYNQDKRHGFTIRVYADGKTYKVQRFDAGTLVSEREYKLG